MLDDVLLHRVKANDIVEIGNFKIEFIHASHSLVDCFSLAIHTPVGTIIHTGDYKIDDTPVIGEPYDLKTLRRIRRRRRARTAVRFDERDRSGPHAVGTGRDSGVSKRYLKQTEGRLFVSTFSSSMHRLQIIFDIAHQFGRKVCVLGRSMQKNVEIAEEQGLLKIAHGTMIDLGDVAGTRRRRDLSIS